VTPLRLPITVCFVNVFFLGLAHFLHSSVRILHFTTDRKILYDFEAALTQAAKEQQESMLQQLLKQEVDIVAQDMNELLLLAASNGHQSVVQLPLDKGSDLERKIRFGETPLHVVASTGKAKMLL
jgi:ankyrin repeat protein